MDDFHGNHPLTMLTLALFAGGVYAVLIYGIFYDGFQTRPTWNTDPMFDRVPADPPENWRDYDEYEDETVTFTDVMAPEGL